MASAATSWKPFPSSPSSEVPRLLVSMGTGPASYSVQLTDMAHVWTENLDRRSICRRAWDLNTSIDPSDTPENMTRFLQSLTAALDVDTPGHNRTSLTLSATPQTTTTNNSLVMRINCDIPGLETLRWEMHLEMSPASAISTAFVLPLLQAQLARNKEVDSLISILKHKDDVLTRLLDKLEATGIGLESVFASLSSRKRISREVACERVKGLAPFEQTLWRQNLSNAVEESETVEGLFNGVFAHDAFQIHPSLDIGDSPKLDSWWHDLSGAIHVSHRNHVEKSTPKMDNPPVANGDTDADDADFQVQPTPSRLIQDQQPRSRVPASLDDDASTASEDELLPAVAVRETAQRSHNRLGGIGGRKPGPGSEQPIPETSRSGARSGPRDGDEIVSEDDDDDKTASLHEDETGTGLLPDELEAPMKFSHTTGGPSPTSTPKKAKLGRIGLQKSPTLQERTEPQKHKQLDEQHKPQPSSKKLGGIGKRIVSGLEEGEASKARGRSPDTSSDRPTPRETSQERADRRRDELKRELEKKAAAGPAKKKRRF